MKKQLSRIAFALSLVTMAQFNVQGQVQPCDTYAAMEEHFRANPQARINYESQQQMLQAELTKRYTSKAMAAFEYTIPVVFHILHQGGSENISDATCIAAVDWVNKDLAKQQADASTVASPFNTFYIPSDIKLMIAHKDKNGNCTSGIIHHNDPRTKWDRSGNLNLLYSGITVNFPSNKYLNIIIVQEIVASPGQTGIVVGYTYKPGTWGSAAIQDAIVYRHDYLSGSKARSLTHELGHWLNLDHTFGNTNNPGVTCGDDGICDTPPTKGNFSSCPSSQSGNTCASSAACGYSAGQQNTENIMDYSSCPKNFTSGQTTVMRNALASSVSQRSNLWQPANIAATDVDGLGICAPIAQFLSTTNLYTVCSGGSLTFKDFSYNGTITAWSWAADNSAIIAASTASQTSILFPVIGTTNVTLTVSNMQGTSDDIKTVLVLDGTPGINSPFMESFEGLGTPMDWSVINVENSTPTWEQNSFTGYHGSSCFYIEGANNQPNNMDILQTPIMNFAAMPSKQFAFAYAYARQSSSHNDNFKVQVSTDCGGSWDDVLSLGSSQLALNSGGIQSNPFTPSNIAEWKTVELSTYPGTLSKWHTAKNSPNLIVRFVFIEGSAGYGNNFFLDAINTPNTVSVNELKQSTRLSIYPNPGSGEVKLNFNLDQNSDVQISVKDVVGKEIVNLPKSSFEAGERTVSINNDQSLSKGVYFVSFNINGSVMTEKLIIE
jgi:hypothetical protein